MLDIDQLVVVTTGGMVPNQVGWKPLPGIFPAETCNRHIYIGVKSDFQAAGTELLAHPKTKYFEGQAAYRFFLEFFNGMHSHYHSDTDTSGQARRAWNAYARKQPVESKTIEPYVNILFADGALVKSKIINAYLSRPTPVGSAVRMAGLHADSKVLIVGGPVELTKQMVTALGYKKRHTPAEITLTHPDARALADIVKDIRAFGKMRAIKARLKTASFDQALLDAKGVNMYNADAVFVGYSMFGQPRSAEESNNHQLVDAWLLRRMLEPHHAGRLYHLSGNPYAQRQTTEPWLELKSDDGFVEFPAIRADQVERVRLVKVAVQQARKVIADITAYRAQGDRVRDIHFDTANPERDVHYTLARRPKGAKVRAADPALVTQAV